MQAPRKPRSLKEVVGIERRVYDTIRKAWVGIPKQELSGSSLPIIGFPIDEIARQFAKAGQEVGAKKRCSPSDDRTIAEMMSHNCGGSATTASRSTSSPTM